MNKRAVSIVVVTILLGGLMALNRKQVMMLPQDEFELNAVGTAGFELKSNIHFRNPNLLSSTIKSMTEEIYLNGVLLGKLENEINQGIPGMRESQFPVSIRFRNEDYMRALGADFAGGKKEFQLKGEIVYQNLVSGGKLKIEQTAKLQTP